MRRGDQDESREEVGRSSLSEWKRTLMLKLLLRKRSGSGESGPRFGCACMDVCALEVEGNVSAEGEERERKEGRRRRRASSPS